MQHQPKTFDELKVGVPSLVIQDAVELRYLERQLWRDRALTGMLAGELARDSTKLSSLKFDWDSREATSKRLATDDALWSGIEDLLLYADSAVRFDSPTKPLSGWALNAASELDGKKDGQPGPSVSELSDCARIYARRPWLWDASFDLWLVRKMLFAEAYALSVEVGHPMTVKSSRFWWLWAKGALKWLVGLYVALTIGNQLGAAFGVGAYVLWLCCIKFLDNDQVASLSRISSVLGLMRNCYVLALREDPCPAELADAMARSENMLAVWPEGTRSILERSLARNRASWFG